MFSFFKEKLLQDILLGKTQGIREGNWEGSPKVLNSNILEKSVRLRVGLEPAFYCHYYYHQHLSLCIVLSLRKASQRLRLTLSLKVLTSVSRSSYSESFSVTLTEVVLSKRFVT